ncbi:MAG: SigE family polymerase sigma factor [Acidobacteria bacterium]|jgi:RNA polymerase sigma-70 factor (ECF subfamily)|nr:SigE family polymerase sigma factor [Acidobacteriota bacterium]
MPDSIGAIYDAQYDLLRFIAVQRFRIPATDVRPIIHDVFVAYLRHREQIDDARLWLAEAVRNACRNYWRDRKPSEPLEVDMVDTRRLVDEVAARIDVARMLTSVTPECRRLLYLRYVEGLDPAEIAERCHIEVGNARIRVHRCLKSIRAALADAKRT